MALHFSKKEFFNRKSNVLKSMKDQNLNSLLMFKQESMYWLSGYDTFGFVFFQSLILRDDGEIIFLSNGSIYLVEYWDEDGYGYCKEIVFSPIIP